MESGSKILSVPPREGKRQNLTNLIKSRTASFPDPSSMDPRTTPTTKIKTTRRPPKDSEEKLAATVSAKIEDGNLKGAIRLLCSEEKMAGVTPETINKLQEKHPPAPADRRPLVSPSPPQQPLQVTEAEVTKAIKSFPPGSSGGPDGLRPQHLLDLIKCAESGGELVASITAFVNLLLRGGCNPQVVPHLFGGNLLALEKKSGGVRPIAVGFTWRRLAAKCANSFASAKLRQMFSPIQLGVGVKGGCEAAVHSTRRFLLSMPDNCVVAKLDFTNAFNSVRRDSMLEAVALHVPEILQFCHSSYAHPTNLLYDLHTISSEEGVQQGDPLGPLLFCLTIQPILGSLTSKLLLGYLDDITIGGDVENVAADIERVRSEGVAVGLCLNVKKCEVITSKGLAPNQPIFTDFIHMQPNQANLLGAPLLEGPAMDGALTTRCEDLRRATNRLCKISAHDALIILRSSLSAPKLLHTLRSSPCFNNPALATFDSLLRDALCKITNNALPENSWIQASLPIRDGGLGIRSVGLLAPSAFLASAASTRGLQNLILSSSTLPEDPNVDGALAVWKSGHNTAPPSGEHCFSQKKWDRVLVAKNRAMLVSSQSDSLNKARLLATSAPHSGDWLHALPITSCGLRLDDESIRVAVGLRLGVNLCEPHICPCGASVDATGTHGLSCKRSKGKMPRHQQINDLVWRALIRANIPAIKEPAGLLRSDGKRPDGLTQIPWQAGKCLTWDVTIVDTLAPSYLPSSSQSAGSAAENAATKKTTKYTDLARSHFFCPLAFESLGPMNDSGQSFIAELGRRITATTGDTREASFLFQRISIAIQRCNAISFTGTFIQPSLSSGDT